MVEGNSYADTSLRQGPDSETSDYRRRRSGSIAVYKTCLQYSATMRRTLGAHDRGHGFESR